LAELRAMDFSYWWIPGADVTPGRPAGEYPWRGRAPSDPRFGIVTVREVLERLPDVVLNFDIKQTAPLVEPYEALLADVLREYGRVDDVIVASFLDPALEAFRRVAPEVATSAGTLATAEAWQAVQAGRPLPESPAVAYQVPERRGDLVVVDEAFVTAAHRAGKAVHVWTVDDRAAMERLCDLGVDGLISDVPTVLDEVLTERGVAWHPEAAARRPGKAPST
jgi:glycerophosphoryl diester phosphodiesterase